MQEMPGTRGRRKREHGCLRGANRWFWEELVLETVGEAVVAITACLTFAGAIAAVLWGYQRAPRSTIALGIGLVALLVYGVVSLRGDSGRPKGVLATIAAGFVVFMGVWALYVFSYCSCSQ